MLRKAMGKRDGVYILAGRIELDEGFFLRKRKRVKRINRLSEAGAVRKRQKCL
jgi:hypothetical protein